MNEDLPPKFIADDDPPASTRDRVSLVGPLPGELNRWPTLALGHPIVDIALNGDEVKVTQAAPFEGQVSRAIEIECLMVPRRAVDDSPLPDKGIATRHVLDLLLPAVQST